MWDHRPHPQDVLEARLARGWTPTASALADGDVVEGYAACVYRPK